ncbi:hypothetical protein DL93DRAFT_2174466 [Clavulina sp. PMI_390]|nr:hypothetical protein DL93DRAFT_2174466 [Clavulina sp. PMI_390]
MPMLAFSLPSTLSPPSPILVFDASNSLPPSSSPAPALTGFRNHSLPSASLTRSNLDSSSAGFATDFSSQSDFRLIRLPLGTINSSTGAPCTRKKPPLDLQAGSL